MTLNSYLYSGIQKGMDGLIITRPFIKKVYAAMKRNYEKSLGFPLVRKRFFEKMGYELDLENPITYNQKLIWKKLFDRNPDLTITADKYLVYDYIHNLIGDTEASKLNIPLLWVGENPEEIPFNSLPDKFVVKPNRGSNMQIIVRNNKNEMKEYIIRSARQWLKTTHGLFHYEWAYQNIQPKIMVQALLETQKGELPEDYKFFCFHGKCHLIRAQKNRFGNEGSCYEYYDTNWVVMPVKSPGYIEASCPFKQPVNLEKMIKVAERLSLPFDAVRIDLYSVDGDIFFGEYTHYHCSGMSKFDPQSFDYYLGRLWRLDPEYWVKN